MKKVSKALGIILPLALVGGLVYLVCTAPYDECLPGYRPDEEDDYDEYEFEDESLDEDE